MKNRLTALIVVIGVLYLFAVADVQAFGQRDCAEDSLCGPRCLLLVCGQYDVEADLEELAAACGIEKGGEATGTSMFALSNAARAKGLDTVAMKIGVDELAALKRRAIDHPSLE